MTTRKGPPGASRGADGEAAGWPPLQGHATPVRARPAARYQIFPDLPIKQFESLNARVFGISVDSVWAHKAFAEKLSIKYPLLADFQPKGAVAQKYGLYLEDKGITSRATVIIDGQGIVRSVTVHDIPEQRSNTAIVDALKKIA